MKKKWLTKSNIVNVVFFALLIFFIFSTDAKGLVIEGLMKVGFFQPNVTQDLSKNTNNTSLNVQFTNSEGKVLSLDDLKGKVVFINFWATWCPPCIAEMPTINSFYEKYKGNKNLVVLMVDVDGNFDKSVKFMERRKFNLEVWKPASPIPSNFLNQSIPTTVILDKKGNIAFRHEGGADYENKDFQQFINQLLQQ
ncbi:MAG: TlpA family protein disulfide reductase [Sphingobacteriales bacterium]|nr:TlpA family protein disulfide reductase [Sphingobacteriales bacterium]